ncbi:MAG TPA: DNA primase, partial [Luteimonas sp.]|nr:DNA primase [Luteimonas sp.]
TIVRKDGADGFDARLREATPLSEFFFAEMAKDVNLGTLDGKARLAERCKPLLAQIPDGAFGDLMRQRLTELTGVGARASAPQTHVPTQRAHAGSGAHAPKRSLVRSAIALLLQQPSLALTLEPPYRFATLRLPGIELLVEIAALVRERPDINTGALLEHFGEREEAAALQKLATHSLPGEGDAWRDEFLDAMAQLEKQTLQQRVDELQAKQRESGLDDADKGELRALLQSRFA